MFSIKVVVCVLYLFFLWVQAVGLNYFTGIRPPAPVSLRAFLVVSVEFLDAPLVRAFYVFIGNHLILLAFSPRIL
jgi:hypothetical protein